MASSSRKLSELAGLVHARIVGDGDPGIADVTHDSRSVPPGSLYVALRGERVDGHHHVPDAVARGAVAVCVDHETAAGVPEMLVPDTRAILGEVSSEVHGRPSETLDVVGVTGTNGKTTVTHFVESIATHGGRVAGLVGTIHTRIAGVAMPATMTTPEAPDFQRLLAHMRDRGVSVVAAEVSSHSLEFGRVRGTRFAVAAFTNLSQDHLDFHGDMSAYRAAKERLFTEYEVGTAVVNVDDPVGRDIASSYRRELLTVGSGGMMAITEPTPSKDGTRFRLDSPWGGAEVVAPVHGVFNVSNLVMGGACCLAIGLPFDQVVTNMARVEGVPGRFEIVSGDDPIVVVVDYAHTPEGVVRAVETGRGMTGGRVIGVVGAGGDRDREKRPAMGAAISSADLAVITSDNPRSEDPRSIVAAVAAGVTPGADHVVEVDRKAAIDLAIDEARDGDLVMILGRGHELVQQAGGEGIPFDDREVALESLLRRRRSADSTGAPGSMSE